MLAKIIRLYLEPKLFFSVGFARSFLVFYRLIVDFNFQRIVGNWRSIPNFGTIDSNRAKIELALGALAHGHLFLDIYL